MQVDDSGSALYHDFDAFKCEVMREAVKAGAIADGKVVCGDIKELDAKELVGYRQCHFFAGGGFWSLAARQAGWPDDRPLWTGSCPCQSFSAAAKGEGFDDHRHLWPEWFRLIRECRPQVITGEQVGAAIGYGWLDLVAMDLEDEGYAVAAAVLPAAAVGAPHIRERLYFCAVSSETRRAEAGQHGSAPSSLPARPEQCGGTGSGADAERGTAERWGYDVGTTSRGLESGAQERERLRADVGADGEFVNGHHSLGAGLEGHFGDAREWRGPGWLDPLTARSVAEAGATRGYWADCDWWYGRDEKYRPIGPEINPLVCRATQFGVQPVADGDSGRVGLLCDAGAREPESAEARAQRLRMYGDAICVPLAAEFLWAVMEVLGVVKYERK